MFIYLKLILVSIVVFVDGDIITKSAIILIFLYMNLKVRKYDPPYLTKRMNDLDLNGAISLLVIFYSLFVATIFDDEIIHILVLIIVLLTNFQFIFMASRRIILFVLYKGTKNSRLKKISDFIEKYFAGKFFENSFIIIIKSW